MKTKTQNGITYPTMLFQFYLLPHKVVEMSFRALVFQQRILTHDNFSLFTCWILCEFDFEVTAFDTNKPMN